MYFTHSSLQWQYDLPEEDCTLRHEPLLPAGGEQLLEAVTSPATLTL